MKSWKNALIGPDTTFEEAVRCVNNSGLRIALIVGSDLRLLGTLTDGDIRRALLRHIALDAPVNQAMCSSPKVGKPDWSRDRLLGVMEGSELLQIPIVDDQNKIVGLETIHGLLDKRQIGNPVFLMAGGFGTRLYPLTESCPKPMLKIGDKPILELIIETFIRDGFYNFFISTHYLPNVIKNHFGDGSRWGVKIRYIHEETPLGTGGALGLLPHEEINEPILVMNGDLLTTMDYRALLEYHNAHASIATMCVREYEQKIPYGVIQNRGNQIISMIEKPVHKFFVNAGIYALSPELVKSVSPGVRIDMPTLLEKSIKEEKQVTMYPLHEYWLDIGRMDDFNRAQTEIAGLLS
jgi:dTDP-glucose pyrophosphorylase